MGAEFTWAYALTFGSRREQPEPPAAPAVPSQTTKRTPDAHMVEAKQAAKEEKPQGRSSDLETRIADRKREDRSEDGSPPRRA